MTEHAHRPAHALDPEHVARELGTDPSFGLASGEAAARLERDGPNELERPRNPAYGRIAARQLFEPLVGLLVAATLVSAAIGETAEATAIGLIVVLNAAFGFTQEVGAERAVMALRASLETTAAVIRDGREHAVPARELVVGDLVRLREGDRVPADARVLLTHGLEVDESLLTGESATVAKGSAAVDVDASRGADVDGVRRHGGHARDRHRRGRGDRCPHRAGCHRGPRRRGGAAADAAAGTSREPVAVDGGARARGDAGAGRGDDGARGVRPGRVPGRRLGGRGGGARGPGGDRHDRACARLPRDGAPRHDRADALRHRDDRRGDRHLHGQDRDADREPAAARPPGAGRREGGGGPPARRGRRVGGGDRPRRSRAGRRRVGSRSPCRRGDAALAPVRGFAPAGHRRRPSRRLGYVGGQGAPEVVLARCAADAGELERLRLVAERWAGEGVRVLAVAARTVEPDERDEDVLESELRPLGLVGLTDPLRSTAAASIRAARELGLDVRMLTGDHALTAAAVARQLELDPDAVHARFTPGDKLRLVADLQGGGEIVAVTGDGVNDAPALRQADVGIAMGGAGTEAAREAASLVITDDDFATIVAAVEEGRRIAGNLRSFLAFLLSANFGEVALFAVAISAGLGPPMTVVQVLAVNLLTDGPPAIALARDPAGSHARPERGRLFGRGYAAALVVMGILVGLAALVAFLVVRELRPDAAQTAAFATVALAELALVFSCRSVRLPSWRLPPNRFLHWAVLVSLLVVVLLVYAPFLQEAMGTVALTLEEVALVVGLALAPAALTEVAKAVGRHR